MGVTPDARVGDGRTTYTGLKEEVSSSRRRTKLPLPPGHYERHHPTPTTVATTKNVSSSLKMWWNSPDTKRKKRVTRYKMYTMEGKMKSSLKKSCKWIKRTCSRIVHGL
ncbi:hypothetical protein LINPERPRIM_LOCUS1662 [Linum perenne]